jgi:hypothetical protein
MEQAWSSAPGDPLAPRQQRPQYRSHYEAASQSYLGTHMADIFLSYTSSDRPRAKQLAALLQRRGWSVWWDRAIPAGRRFEDVIAEQLSQARCVVVLWSKASTNSSWVREEASDARDRNILVPVLIERVNQPLGFRGIQTADLVEWTGSDDFPTLVQLLADLASHLGDAAQPAPRPMPEAVQPPAVAREPVRSATGAPSPVKEQGTRPSATPSRSAVDAPRTESQRSGAHPIATIQLLVFIALFALMALIDIIVVFSQDPVAWYGGRANESGSEFTIPLAAAAISIGFVLVALGVRGSNAALQRYGWISAASAAMLSAIHWSIMMGSDAGAGSGGLESFAFFAFLADAGTMAVVARGWWKTETSGQSRLQSPLSAGRPGDNAIPRSMGELFGARPSGLLWSQIIIIVFGIWLTEQIVAVALRATTRAVDSIYSLLQAFAFVACILLAALVPFSKPASAILAAAAYAILSTVVWYVFVAQAYGLSDTTDLLMGVARRAFLWLALVVATLHVFAAGPREWRRLALGLVVASLVHSAIEFAFQPPQQGLLRQLTVEVVLSLLLTGTLWLGNTRGSVSEKP